MKNATSDIYLTLSKVADKSIKVITMLEKWLGIATLTGYHSNHVKERSKASGGLNLLLRKSEAIDRLQENLHISATGVAVKTLLSQFTLK